MNEMKLIIFFISYLYIWKPGLCSGIKITDKHLLNLRHGTVPYNRDSVEKDKRSRRPSKSSSGHGGEKSPKLLDSIISHAITDVLSSMSKETKSKLDTLWKDKESNEKRNTPRRPTAMSTLRQVISKRPNFPTSKGDLPDPFDDPEASVVESIKSTASARSIPIASQSTTTATAASETTTPSESTTAAEIASDDELKQVLRDKAFETKTKISNYRKKSKNKYNYLNLNVYSSKASPLPKKRKPVPRTAVFSNAETKPPDQHVTVELSEEEKNFIKDVDPFKSPLYNGYGYGTHVIDNDNEPSKTSNDGTRDYHSSDEENNNEKPINEDGKLKLDQNKDNPKEKENQDSVSNEKAMQRKTDSKENENTAETENKKFTSKFTSNKDDSDNNAAKSGQNDKVTTNVEKNDETLPKSSNNNKSLKETQVSKGDDKDDSKTVTSSHTSTSKEENTDDVKAVTESHASTSKVTSKEEQKQGYDKQKDSKTTNNNGEHQTPNENKKTKFDSVSPKENSSLDLNEAVSDMQTVINTAFGKNASAHKQLSDYEVVVEKSVDNKKHISINEPDLSVSIALNSSSNRDQNIDTLQNVIKMLNAMKFKEEDDTEAKHAINEPANITKTSDRNTTSAVSNTTRAVSNTTHIGRNTSEDFSYFVHGGDVYKVIKIPAGEKKAEWTKENPDIDAKISNKDKEIISNLIDTASTSQKVKSMENGSSDDSATHGDHMIIHERHDSGTISGIPLMIANVKDFEKFTKNIKIKPTRSSKMKKHWRRLGEKSDNLSTKLDTSSSDDDLSYLQSATDETDSESSEHEKVTKENLKKKHKSKEDTDEAISSGDDEASGDDVRQEKFSPASPKHASKKQTKKQKPKSSYYIKQGNKNFRVDVSSSKPTKPAKTTKSNKHKPKNFSSLLLNLTDEGLQKPTKQTDSKTMDMEELAPNSYEIRHNNKIYKITEIPDKHTNKESSGTQPLPAYGKLLQLAELAGLSRPIYSVTGVSRTAPGKALKNVSFDTNINGPSTGNIVPSLLTGKVTSTETLPGANIFKQPQAVLNTKYNTEQVGFPPVVTNIVNQPSALSGVLNTAVPVDEKINTGYLLPAIANPTSKILSYSASPLQVPMQDNALSNQKNSSDLLTVDEKNIGRIEQIIRKDPPSTMQDTASIMQQSNVVSSSEQNTASLPPTEKAVSFNITPLNSSNSTGFSESFNKTLYEEVML